MSTDQPPFDVAAFQRALREKLGLPPDDTQQHADDARLYADLVARGCQFQLNGGVLDCPAAPEPLTGDDLDRVERFLTAIARHIGPR